MVDNLRCSDCFFLFERPEYKERWEAKRYDALTDDDVKEIEGIRFHPLRQKVIRNNLVALRQYWEDEEGKKPIMVPTGYADRVSFRRTIPKWVDMKRVLAIMTHAHTEFEAPVPESPAFPDSVFTKFVLSEIKQCSNPKQIYTRLRTFFGPHQGVLLKAADADDLLKHFTAGLPYDKVYNFEHAICPYIYDVWNCRYTSSTFLYYYKSFEDLKDVPCSLRILFSLWDRCNDNTYYHFVH